MDPHIETVDDSVEPAAKDEETIEQRLVLRESENKKMREEFNIQRAKMKELYLQKEEEAKTASQEKIKLEQELELARTQLEHLQRANNSQSSEIESLQLLVQETLDASSNTSNEEVRRLQMKCTEYEQQINSMNRQSTSSPDITLAPSAIVQAVTKRIARRLGADPNYQDNLEDSMKKAQEDADVLRSLVVPLEEEIVALKNKLREVDSQLQQANQTNESRLKASKASDSVSMGKDFGESGCDMCANYEAQLVSEQAKSKEYSQEANKLRVSLKKALEELEKEANLRRDSLVEWQAVQDEVQKQISYFKERIAVAEMQQNEVRYEMKNTHAELLDKVTQLTVDRETLQETLNSLQDENERLMGKYSACAKKLQSDKIDLPDNLSDLQEYALQLREELIISMMELERAQASEQTLVLLQKHAEEIELLNEDIKSDNDELRMEINKFAAEKEQVNAVKEKIRTVLDELKETKEEKEKLEKRALELQGKVISLQKDLNTSEAVQKDFVRLSQTLQVQLERIRGSDVEVRWQHDEDVDECSNCHANFSVSRKKQHCRHCGRIFCANCLSHTVNSGPRGRPAHVCDVCYTLLVRDTAPYFSNEVPHTPD